MKHFFLLSLVLLYACSATLPKEASLPGELLWDQNRYSHSPGSYERDRLLVERQGWKLWRKDLRKEALCIAFKPAQGEQQPAFSGDFAFINGGSGFYIAFKDNWSKPYLGFYGEYSHGKNIYVDYQGETLRTVDNQQLIVSWEGQQIAFDIDTQPTPDTYQEVETQSGVMDFSGASDALAGVVDCHRLSS